MGSRLPKITEGQFRRRLATSVPRLVEEAVVEEVVAGKAVVEAEPPAISDELAKRLYHHYRELLRWNPRVSLVGPGTAADLVQRHYGESLAALPLLRAEDRTLVDVGSGAGFPGLVLAAARESLAVTLIEPRNRKWVFLRAVVRKLGLSCQCLNARLDARQEGSDGPLPAGLPSTVDLITCRALKIPPELFESLLQRFPRIRFLLWHGERRPEIPESLRIRRQWRLSGSRQRRILEIQADPTSYDDHSRARQSEGRGR